MSSAQKPNQGTDAPPVADQERFLRQILDINPNLIFAKDRFGHFTLVNRAVADIYGTTVEGLLGKTDADFNPNPEQVAFFRQMDLQVMDSLQDLVIPEEVITDASGKRHWLQTVKRPIIGANGKADQVLGVATDITQRRELEEQLRQAQKLEAIGQLAGGLAHDFNNMLAVILGNSERLLGRCKKAGLERSFLESLELIQTAGKRAADLVHQLLTFSRRNPVTPIVLNVGEVVTRLTELLTTIVGKKTSLVFRVGDADANIHIDQGNLEQVVVNLVVNARDAMPGGGEVVVATSLCQAPRKLHPPIPLAGPCVVLTVSDVGTGIPSDVIDRIFEPFYSTKPKGKGTGLGLSIVYGIAQQNGGHVDVQSTPGKGSTFRIAFPIVNAPATLTRSGRSSQCGPGTETVLVCEDEPAVLQLLSQTLKENGYRVLAAQRSEECIQQSRAYDGPIHLLLSDVVMPGQSGYELAEALESARPGIKVLLLSGYHAAGLPDKAARKISRRILPKPFEATTLLRAIREVLDEPQASGSRSRSRKDK